MFDFIKSSKYFTKVSFITVIFNYVLIPTKDMLDYNANIYDKDN